VRPLRLLDRLIYAASGIGLLLPVGAFAQARWFNLAGAAIAAGLFVWERANRARRPSPTSGPAAAVEASAAGGAPLAGSEQRAFLNRMGVRGTGEGE
jgi:hypothetical protein